MCVAAVPGVLYTLNLYCISTTSCFMRFYDVALSSVMQLCICVSHSSGQMDDVLDSVCIIYHSRDNYGYASVLVSGLYTHKCPGITDWMFALSLSVSETSQTSA